MSQQEHREEWDAMRIGKVSASHAHEVLAKGKGVTRNKYMVRLALERLTGIIEPTFQSQSMERGIEIENEARRAYEGEKLTPITEALFVDHPTIPMLGCSPDGLAGDDGLIEIKCRDSHNHIAVLLGAKVDRPAFLQTQTQMAVTGRQWTDYVHYDSRCPHGLDLYIKRIESDAVIQNEICLAVIQFNQELDELLAKLKALQGK